jgi:uncharacterized protein YfiM (DUF2279 family)
MLILRGPVSISGDAPLPIDNLPTGNYVLAAEAPALPAIRGRVFRSDDGLISRRWAGISSLVAPPGIVHLAAGEKRGLVLAASGGLSIAMSIAKTGRLSDAERDEESASSAYERAISETEIAQARATLAIQREKVTDSREVRNLWLTYAGISWIGSSLEAMLFTPQPRLDKRAEDRWIVILPRASGWGGALRSAIFPGAGQRYMGHHTRANLFTTAIAAGAAGTLFAHENFLNARRDQLEAQLRLERVESEVDARAAREELRSAADRTDRMDIVQWSLAGATAGFYVWNILNAWGPGHSQPDHPVSLLTLPQAGGFYVCAQWSIR